MVLFISVFVLQLKWGAHAQVGSGLSSGETTKLANSYMSRLGVVTRHMTVAGNDLA